MTRAARRPAARHRASTTGTARLIVAKGVPLPADTVFAALVDVAAQSRWILATRVRAGPGGSHHGGPRGDAARRGASSGVGTELVARTGVGPVGFTDTMRVLDYRPPRRWRVAHTGSLVRGWGEWGVLPDGHGCRVYWAEEFELPAGTAGRVGWLAIGWLVRAGIRYSLARLDRGLRSGSLIGPGSSGAAVQVADRARVIGGCRPGR